MKTKFTKNDWIWILAIVFLIVVIVVYLLSLGTVNISKEQNLPEELNDPKEVAAKKHKALLLVIDQKIQLKRKLEFKFKVVYTCVRIALVSLWMIPIVVFYNRGKITSMDDLLNYSEMMLIIAFTINFLTFGSLASLNEFLNSIKTKVENWVWSSNLSLTIEIEDVKNQLMQLEQVETSDENFNEKKISA